MTLLREMVKDNIYILVMVANEFKKSVWDMFYGSEFEQTWQNSNQTALDVLELEVPQKLEPDYMTLSVFCLGVHIHTTMHCIHTTIHKDLSLSHINAKNRV